MMTVIMPPVQLLNADKVIRAVENTLDNAAKNVKVDFQVTTETFDHKVEFVIESTQGRREV